MRTRLLVALLVLVATWAAVIPSAPAASATLSVSPSSFSFETRPNGSNPGSQTLRIRNSGDGTMRFTLSDNASWLRLSRSSGTAPANAEVSVRRTGLADGVYSAYITVTAAGAVASPRNIPVTFKVGY